MIGALNSATTTSLKRRPARAVLFGSALGASMLAGLSAASAQTVYRCGPEGRDYSQVPFPHGRVVDVSDGRDLGQREQAAALAAAVRAVGRALEQRGAGDYRGVYGQLYARFGITSYKNLRREKYEQALAWLRADLAARSRQLKSWFPSQAARAR